MQPIPFIDAHFHLWQRDHLDYPWLSPPFDDSGPNGSVAAIAHDYRVADYRADLADWNLVAAVHVDAGAAPHHALDETRWLDTLAATEGLPTAIVAYSALDDPAAAQLLAAQAACARVRGIRQILNWHPDPRRSYTPADLTQDDRWRRGFAALAAHGLSFDLQCYPDQMAGLAPLLDRHPDIPVILNHLGMPVLSDPDGVARWRAGMRALAAVPSVSVKLSGLGFIRRDWTYETVRPFLTETLALFGPARCMFASDAPTDTLFAPLAQYLDAYRLFSADLSEDEQRALWGGNAARTYRLALPAEGQFHA